MHFFLPPVHFGGNIEIESEILFNSEERIHHFILIAGNHLHADMLEGGSFVLDAHAYYFSDIVDGAKIRPVGTVNFGIIEWVNVEAGYTGGFSLGVKARILGETRPWMPSFALGIHNLFTHREAYLYDRLQDSLGSELYFVLGKSIEPHMCKLFIHSNYRVNQNTKIRAQINFFFIWNYRFIEMS